MLFSYIEKHILILIFVIAVIIDVINGYTQQSLHRETLVGILFRGGIWLFFLFTVCQCGLILKKLLVILIVIITCLIIWYLAYDAPIFTELNNLVRLTYVFVLFAFFYINRNYYDKIALYKYIMIYGCLIASVIITCFVFGIGYSSYGKEDNQYGWGTTGLFIAQNDLSLTFVCSLIISCIYYNYCRTTIAFVGLFFIGIGAVLVGTRVCFFFIPLILLIESYFIFKQNGNYIHKLLLSINIAVFIPILALLIYFALDEYALAKLTIESIGNARAGLTDYGKEYIKSLDGFSLLIGEGAGNFRFYIAKKMLYLDKSREVEADFYDIVGSYGYLLGSIVLSFYLYFSYKSIILYLKNKSSETFFMAILFFLFVIIGYLAGHAATNVMAAPIYALSANIVLRFCDVKRIVIIES